MLDWDQIVFYAIAFLQVRFSIDDDYRDKKCRAESVDKFIYRTAELNMNYSDS